jgi:V-type H+-transporting ATPase subunit a
MVTFERLLWRVLRGNLFMSFAEVEEPIQDPLSDENIFKNVFVVFVAGQELMTKIKKISESLGATIYPVDASPVKRSEDALEVSARIEDLTNVLYNTNATRRAELLKVSEVIDQWTVFVKKAKGTYYAMNLFNYDSTRKCLIAEGWCPSTAINSIQYALHSVSERSGSMVPPVLNRLWTSLEPPTCHKTNKFTEAFQAIVDAYGYAKYKEVNPGLFTIITFPFLFAVMFGDFGHGTFVTLIAIYLIMNEKKFTGPGQGEVKCNCFLPHHHIWDRLLA